MYRIRSARFVKVRCALDFARRDDHNNEMRLHSPFRCFARALPRPRLGGIVTGASLLAAAAVAALPMARAFAPGGPAGAEAAAAAGPVSTAALGARCIGAAFDDTPAFQAAIDTGHTVYAPALGGECHITRPLVMKTPGQIFYGDGRARTKILIQPGFAGAGVFVAKTGEPGPVWRDFSVSFAQPDTDDLALLQTEPPAFLVLDTPRFQITNIGCFVATICVDMRGNSGGASIDDLQFSSFKTGIEIDGSLDNVRFDRLHWFPFALTQKQTSVFFGKNGLCPVGINVARVDGLYITNSLFDGCLALNIFQSSKGFASGQITSVDFDRGSGIVMSAGAIGISGGTFAIGKEDAQAINAKSGSIMLVGVSFLIGADLKKPFIETDAISLSVSSSIFAMGERDVTAIRQAKGVTILTANTFMRAPNRTYQKPTLSFQNGQTIMMNCVTMNKGSGNGIFAEIGNDNPANKFIGNSALGWPAFHPNGSQGIYEANR